MSSNQPTPGTYKVLCKEGELSTARTWMALPSSRLFVDNIEKGDYAKWRLTPVDGDKAGVLWQIRNIKVEDFVFAEPKVGSKIIGREEEEGLKEVMWRLEDVGQGTFQVHRLSPFRIIYPGTDLAWTAESVPTKIPGRVAWEIFLHEKTAGKPEQQFKLCAPASHPWHALITCPPSSSSTSSSLSSRPLPLFPLLLPPMSNVKLTLRPPPNVDFVHGYPGIPPSQDRPQAAVKGAIEVRTPAAGVKAQWVRIELRKVETLPGGGDSNTFYDYVGPSPVTLWTAPDEYNILRTQDFPFSIRIPESIPPSVALENRAGIQYELVATVCTKGKKGFLRKRKNIVTKEIAPVIIDKHELHSTWPVYCQPEKRQLAQEGVTLIVERRHTCYGPGDRITVVATLKSDNLHTVILRGFEMTLKETTIFRAQAFAAARKAAPLVKVMSIGETKLAINATLYGGTMHQAELSCQLPPNHTTTTLNAARHIDVTYVLSVKALMGTGTHITMDLPVIISNWQRYVSQEAVRRIGVAPALSLAPASAPVMSVEPSSPTRSQQPATTTTLPTTTHGRTPSTSQFNTVPTSSASGRPGTADASNVPDEFGYGAGYGKTSQRDTKGYQNDTTTARPTTANSATATSTARRPNSARASNAANRFTITNAEPEVPEEHIPTKVSAANSGAPSRNISTGQPKVWPTAEEEKRAYEMAKSRVEQIQGVAAPPAPAPAPAPAPVVAPPGPKPASPGPPKQQWLSAAEEKALLYEKAQAAVNKAQRQVHDAERSVPSSSGSGSGKPTPSEIYQQAMANVNANPNRSQPPPTHISPLSGQSRKTSANAHAPKVPQYLTAEQEKAALKRYEEARSAVDRLHNPDAAAPGPIAYDSLYPQAGGSSSAMGPLDAPPSFDSISGSNTRHPTAAEEKEALAKRIRAVDVQPPNQYAAPPPFDEQPTSSPVQPPSGLVPGQAEYRNAAAEKEVLRRKFEARDAAARKKSSNATAIPPRNASLGAGMRPSPTPPPANSGPISSASAVLSAAEEKAILKAKLEAKDAKAQRKAGINGHTPSSPRHPPTTPPPTSPSPASFAHQQAQYSPSMNHASLPPMPGSPPPLMPRPPAEYIQETQEEDERVYKIAVDDANLPMEGNGTYVNGYVNGQNGVMKAPGPPPPLPPKPAGE
ncbi:hypothetical protein NP233_g4145 [Leucocoprinus birnbaumii]|uniref:Arrestin C-terminal-like domain-containing protein n=1 Tax=Leucocoprinus birnbaumii TaxID=56174 RepID=A0AAD5VYZ0_9AGAR|nr:hypothetical protein NP233_g4145 [Leucocoprinus birnbaumii]